MKKKKILKRADFHFIAIANTHIRIHYNVLVLIFFMILFISAISATIIIRKMAKTSFISGQTELCFLSILLVKLISLIQILYFK